MKPENYKWIAAALFVAGFLVGALILPLPRYKPMGSGTWAIDTWTGKIYGYATQADR